MVYELISLLWSVLASNMFDQQQQQQHIAVFQPFGDVLCFGAQDDDEIARSFVCAAAPCLLHHGSFASSVQFYRCNIQGACM